MGGCSSGVSPSAFSLAPATTAPRLETTSTESAKAAATTAEAPATTLAEPTTVEATTSTTIARTTTTAAPKLMPDLVGKTTTDAKSALAALGVKDVRVKEQENIAPPGSVLDQVPTKGATITGPVDLTVSKALSPMPDFASKLIGDARTYFSERGVKVTVTDQLDDTKPEGTIVETTPGPGESLGSEVKLTVVKKPVTEFLAKTKSVDDQCGTTGADVGVNGATQLQSVVVSADRVLGDVGRSCYTDYNLSRQWVRLKGGVGISDTSTATLQCRLEVFADGNPIFNQTVSLGEISPIDLDVTNVLRLRLQVTETARGSGGCVWTGLRIIGAGTAG
jgi:hypothetical protein